MAREDMVADMHREVVKALESGETMESFRGRVGPWLEQRGWRPPPQGGSVPHRLDRIYRTNMRTARAAGQWERVQRTRDLLPYLVYSLGPSEEHRPEHEAWAGIILPVSDPWWSTHYPPNGWGCRCRVRQVSERERGRLLAREGGGYRTEAPQVRGRKWVNPVTRVARQVPEGVDPGWDYNPGAHRTLGIHRALLERAERMVEGRGGTLPGVAPEARARLAAESIRGHLRGPGFRWFMQRPRAAAPPRWDSIREAEAFPVGVLPPGVLPGAASRVVRLAEPVADKQWRRHGPGRGGRRARRAKVPIDWWGEIQQMLESIPPTPVPGRGGRWQFLDVGGGRRLIVGLDPDGRPAAISLHPRRFGGRPGRAGHPARPGAVPPPRP